MVPGVQRDRLLLSCHLLGRSRVVLGIHRFQNPVEWRFLAIKGFFDSSVGSACNAGDPGSIPGLGRSPREGIGYPQQYSWAFLVAQMIKNSPTMWETWIQSVGWEDPLEEGVATQHSVLAWRIPMNRGAWRVHGVTELHRTE